MKKNLAILLLALLTVVNVAALVTIGYHRLRFDGHPRPMAPPVDPGNVMKQELGLSEAQTQEFQARFEKFRTETQPIMDSLEAKKAEIVSEIFADQPNMDKLDRLAGEIRALQTQLQKKMALHLLEGKSLLTPQQQKKFFSLLKEGPGRAKGMREPGAMVHGSRETGAAYVVLGQLCHRALVSEKPGIHLPG